MARRKWIWGMVAVAALPAGWFAWSKWDDVRHEREFQRELESARREGIPTSAAEFAATIQSASPEENAAPLYRQLKPFFAKRPAVLDRSDFSPVDDAESLRQAHDAVLQLAEPLAILERAAALPRYWFDREWDDGAAVLLPEYMDLNTGARLLLLRGSLAARRGDAASAIQDAERVMAIAGHVGEEPLMISGLVRLRLVTSVVRRLAEWSLRYRTESRYLGALRKAADSLHRPDLPRETSAFLYERLSLIELAATAEGRTKLGLKDDDLPHAIAQTLLPMVADEKSAKARIVRAAREYRKALGAPPGERALLLQEARGKSDAALLAFPVAAKVLAMLESADEDPVIERLRSYELAKIRARALVRALETESVPASIRTDDLLSPYDGKRLVYRFDGRQIVLEVSGSPAFRVPQSLPK